MQYKKIFIAEESEFPESTVQRRINQAGLRLVPDFLPRIEVSRVGILAMG